MVIVVQVTKMMIAVDIAVVVDVVVDVMVLVRMVMVVMMVMVWGIVGQVHVGVGRLVPGHNGGCGRFQHCGRHGTHFAATPADGRGGGRCCCRRRRRALVTHRLVHVGHVIVSAIRTSNTQQVTRERKQKKKNKHLLIGVIFQKNFWGRNRRIFV